MAVNKFQTVAEFNDMFPEFQSVHDEKQDLIVAMLQAAQQQLSPTEYGNKLNRAHGLLTAHMLASAPGGQMARLESDEGMTTYSVQLKTLTRHTVLGVLVSGGCSGC